MNAIVVVDANWNIGYKGKLLCHLKRDLAYFKEHTLGGIVIMGRKTLESLPNKKGLPGRINIVVSSKAQNLQALYTQEYADEAPLFVESVADSLELATTLANEHAIPASKIFCIGGGSLYKAMLPLCTTVYVTKIHDSFVADTQFPNLDALPDWECTSKGPLEREGTRELNFCVYTKV